MAAWTFLRRGSLTGTDPLITWDTVPTATPARSATSFMVGMPFPACATPGAMSRFVPASNGPSKIAQPPVLPPLLQSGVPAAQRVQHRQNGEPHRVTHPEIVAIAGRKGVRRGSHIAWELPDEPNIAVTEIPQKDRREMGRQQMHNEVE